MRRGVTLLELTVSATVLIVVTVLGALLLVRTTNVTLKGTLRVEMQQQAVQALNRIVNDMRKSTAAGISVRSGNPPRAIAICPLSQPELRAGQQPAVQGDGKLRWSSFFLLYWHDGSAARLQYREWPPPGTAPPGTVVPTPEEIAILGPRRLSPARLAEVLNGAPGREVTVVSGVTAFNLTYPPTGSDEEYVQPLTIQLVQQRRGNTGLRAPETFTYTRTVFLAEQR